MIVTMITTMIAVTIQATLRIFSSIRKKGNTRCFLLVVALLLGCFTSFFHQSTLSIINILDDGKSGHYEQQQTTPQQHYVPVTQDDRQYKILLFSFIYGGETDMINDRPLVRVFLETANLAAGGDSSHLYVKTLLIGDTEPNFPLPPNVEFLLLPWTQLLDRLESTVSSSSSSSSQNRVDLSILKEESQKNTTTITYQSSVDPKKTITRSIYYKVNDYKPLFGAMFPKELEEYDYWGHVDVDLILGDLSQVVTKELLESKQPPDIITLMPNDKPYGPFTIYKNIEKVNTLYKYAPNLPQLFTTYRPMWFDEWGQGGIGSKSERFENSMGGILQKYKQEFNITIHSINGGSNAVLWHTDGNCNTKENAFKEKLEIESLLLRNESTSTDNNKKEKLLLVQDYLDEHYRYDTCTPCYYDNGQLTSPIYKNLNKWKRKMRNKKRGDNSPIPSPPPILKNVTTVLCHYQFGKFALEQSLSLPSTISSTTTDSTTTKTVLDDILQSKQFGVSSYRGFFPLQ